MSLCRRISTSQVGYKVERWEAVFPALPHWFPLPRNPLNPPLIGYRERVTIRTT